MREIKAIVNGFFAFAIYLSLYALVAPGPARGHHRSSPRVLRMDIRDAGATHRSNVSITVPLGLVRAGVRLAASPLRRELDISFHESIDKEMLREVWKELSSAAEGSDVVREVGRETLSFKKDGAIVVFGVKGRWDDERATMRFPLRLLETLVSDERDFDVEALLGALKMLEPGDLLEVESPTSRVRVYTE